jgi:hypothetical protein
MTKEKGVRFGDRFFWAFDVAAGVFLKHLIDEAAASEGADAPWLSEAVSRWRPQAVVTEFGLTLEEEWSSSQRQTFIELAERACGKLAMRESIPEEEIVNWKLVDNLRIDTRGAKEVLTAPVIELGRAIIAIVSGNLPPSPEGGAWYYGPPGGRTSIRMQPSWDESASYSRRVRKDPDE